MKRGDRNEFRSPLSAKMRKMRHLQIGHIKQNKLISREIQRLYKDRPKNKRLRE